MVIRRLCILIPLIASLQGCFFVVIPGSVVGAVSDAVTGSEGEHCVGADAVVGGKIKLADGDVRTVKSLSGTSTRCKDDKYPVRAKLVAESQSSVSSTVVLSGFIYGPPGVSGDQMNADKEKCEASTPTEGDIAVRRSFFANCMVSKGYTVAPIGVRRVDVADRGCTSSENAVVGHKLLIDGKTRFVDAVIGPSNAVCKDPLYPLFVALTPL